MKRKAIKHTNRQTDKDRQTDKYRHRGANPQAKSDRYTYRHRRKVDPQINRNTETDV